MKRWKNGFKAGAAMGALLSLMGAQSGCSTISHNDTEGDAEPSMAAIIGGQPATDRVFDAVGTVGYFFDGEDGKPAYKPYCSATLVSPTAVLTSKFCGVWDFIPSVPTLGWRPQFFSIGGSANSPGRTVQIASVVVPNERGTQWIGGAEEFGPNNVALLIPAEPVTDIAPLKVASRPVTQADVGRRFTAVGFGSSDHEGSDGTERRMGEVTVRATSGSPMRLIFPTFEAFLAFRHEADEGVWPAAADAYHRGLYDAQLVEGSELFAGFVAGDAQPCVGDLGGPLLEQENGEWVVRAVHAYALNGPNSACEMGGFFANLAPAVQTVLQSRNDRCAGIGGGHCSGAVAIRCEGGQPRLEDCAAAGCGSENGVATCGAPARVPEKLACNATRDLSPQSLPLRQVAESAPVPVGGTIRDGAYVLTDYVLYTGPGGATGTVEGDLARGTLTFSGGNIFASSTGHYAALPIQAPLGDGSPQTLNLTIDRLGEGFMDLTSTCPLTYHDTIYFTAQGDELAVFYYYAAPDVYVGRYKRVE